MYKASEILTRAQEYMSLSEQEWIRAMKQTFYE